MKKKFVWLTTLSSGGGGGGAGSITRERNKPVNIDDPAEVDKEAAYWSSIQGETGGLKSGEMRLATAEEAYRNRAFDLALAIRTEQAGLSQEKLATEIAFRWRWEEPCRESMLVTLIRKWEREGKLPRRQK